MIYKFLLVSDEVDDFKREIIIDADNTFLELHDIILESVGYTNTEMSSFFICDDDWEKQDEITLMDMGSDSDQDVWLMASTPLSELISDEGQRLIFIFDYMTERSFFIELKSIETGKSLDAPKCTKKVGEAPKQIMDIEEFDEKKATSATSDFDEDFYGEDSYDQSELDDGFDINDIADPNSNF